MPRPTIHPSATARAAARESRVVAEGGRVMRLILPAPVAHALDTLTAEGLSATAAVSLALLDAEKKKLRRVKRTVDV